MKHSLIYGITTLHDTTISGTIIFDDISYNTYEQAVNAYEAAVQILNNLQTHNQIKNYLLDIEEKYI